MRRSLRTPTSPRKHKQYLLSRARRRTTSSPSRSRAARVATCATTTGTEYLDFFGGILTVSVGHANDKVNAAVRAQMERLGHVSTVYPTLPIVELAEQPREARSRRVKLDKAFFCASGTEADETAVALAQAHTGRQELIALRHGYSGRSLLAQSLVGARQVPRHPDAGRGHQARARAVLLPLPVQPEVPELRPEVRQGRRGADPDDDHGPDCRRHRRAHHGRRRLHHAARGLDEGRSSDIIRKYGGIFIADEVQTGFGRTGGKMWGIEHDGVTPDVMTMAKGIANGYPISAVLATTRHRRRVEGRQHLDLRRQPHLVDRGQRDHRRRSSTTSSPTTRRPWASSCARASTP